VFDKYKTLLIQRQSLSEQPAVADDHRFQVVCSSFTPTDVVRTEGFVDQLLAGVGCIGNVNSHGFNHKIPSLG
jgi:hypothetical protein